MELSHILVVCSALISIGGAYAYMRDTLRGSTKPNRVSWSMWALAPLIGVGAAISAGADMWTVVRIFLAGFLPLLVLIASFFSPKSYWKTSAFDLMCGGASVAALICWLVFSNPIMAVLLAAIGDGFASIPTLVKAWKAPEPETASTYVASFVSVILVLPSIPVWDIPNSAFQIYLLSVNLLLMAFVYRRKVFWSKSRG
jgi:hypothetical protein